ncbi:acyltransferase family protein [Isoptericola cucumis]|uniref:Acyltransferase n=1 Tax=Isoptericola cucumis TaxID=1776856 RepID=A0ABQ2B6H5_9MICO|nr:acyltransferase family protein [Isoptericola cucumis]GGI08658.1 acyltransferase [Isoptericola cucumis]
MSHTLDQSRPTPHDGTTAAPRRALRWEVQALRALAVGLVVAFHFWPGRLPGGYVGVDVFFVISGFLITGHLLREAETTGRVRLGRFWARRARRLLPAAYLVIAVSAAATLLLVPPILWQQWFREILGATLYAENWVLAADAVDYLAAETDPSPVQHHWSLSAEEQFYLVWPLLVLLATLGAARAGRSARGVTAAVLGVASVASFGYSLWLTTENPSSAYFVTTTRAWQFGAGALLALALARQRRRPVPDAWRTPVSWAGLAVVVACAFVYDAETPFPGTAALVPVLGTAAVIWAGTPAGRLSPAPLFTWRPVQYAGEISYALYLWHWPAIVLAPFVLRHEPGLAERVALLAGVVLLSVATKRFVEDPARFSHRWGMQRTGRALGLTAAGAAVLALAAGCAWGVAAHETKKQGELAQQLVRDEPECFGAAAMDPEEPCENPGLERMVVPSPEAVSEDKADYPGCWVDVDEDELKDCTFGPVDDADVPHVVLVGDSHARAMMPALVGLAAQGRISLTAHVKSACAWSTGAVASDPEGEQARTCERWRDRLAPWLVRHAAETDLVVTTAYQGKLTGGADQQAREMATAWRPVADRGVPVVALSDNPSHPREPARCLGEVTRAEADRCASPRRQVLPEHQTLAAAAESVPGASYVDLTDFYCRDVTCPAVIGGVNVYRDAHHLTTTYTKTMAPYLLRELRRAGALD